MTFDHDIGAFVMNCLYMQDNLKLLDIMLFIVFLPLLFSVSVGLGNIYSEQPTPYVLVFLPQEYK